jgi:hypothetical protein
MSKVYLQELLHSGEMNFGYFDHWQGSPLHLYPFSFQWNFDSRNNGPGRLNWRQAVRFHNQRNQKGKMVLLKWKTLQEYLLLSKCLEFGDRMLVWRGIQHKEV